MSDYASSLDILNQTVLGAVVTWLHDVMQFDISTAAYNPVDDVETDFTRLRETSPETNLSPWPGLVVTRGDIASMLNPKSQSWKFTSPYEGGAVDKQINYRLVEMEYALKVYCQTLQQCEYLLNQLIVLNPTKVPFYYHIPWVEPQQFECVMTLKLPGTESKTVTDDARKTEGQFYCVKLTPTIRALLIAVPAAAPKVTKIYYTVLDQQANRRLDGVIITNTGVTHN